MWREVLCSHRSQSKEGVIMLIDYRLVKTLSLWGKYIGLATIATMAWINLHYKTTQDGGGAGYTRILTPAGRIFRLVLIVSVQTRTSCWKGEIFSYRPQRARVL
jgi:hypothetical protein